MYGGGGQSPRSYDFSQKTVYGGWCGLRTELVKLMKAKAAASSDIPAAAERFTTRIDEKPPTITISDSDMSLAGSLFGQGKMALPSL